jgi:hypothetical protein
MGSVKSLQGSCLLLTSLLTIMPLYNQVNVERKDQSSKGGREKLHPLNG